MERTGERTYERALPRRFLRAGRGQGAQTPPPRPAPPPPLSSSATKSLTDADHFGMIRTAQRRFAPTVISITRNSDRHQIGMSDRHRRNTHLSENLTKRPPLRNFLHPLNCEEPTLVTAIRLAMDERHRSGWFERDAEGVGLRLNWAGHGERLDEGVGIPGLSRSEGRRVGKECRSRWSPDH